ncbi:MAG: zinc-ribbon domain-containing protein [Deltaproteobacteria bacterium]|nr:zinc-ribbon domain-containing protein [Candidatus Zymogenaceae bacterium]
MKITCPQCGTSGNLSDKLIPDDGRTVKCPKCKHGFIVTPERQPILENEILDATYRTNKNSLPINDLSENDRSLKSVDPKTAKTAGIIGYICLVLFALFAIGIYVSNLTTDNNYIDRRNAPLTKEDKDRIFVAAFAAMTAYYDESKNLTDAEFDHKVTEATINVLKDKKGYLYSEEQVYSVVTEYTQ